MATTTLTRRRPPQTEFCPLCRTGVEEKLDTHIAAQHPRAQRCSDIIWIGKREAVYRGTHYKPKGDKR